MSWSVHIDNEQKDVLILRKYTTDGLYDNLLTAESENSINFTYFKCFKSKLQKGLDYMKMSLIFQLIMTVLILIIFYIFINI